MLVYIFIKGEIMLYLRRQLAARINDLMKQLDVTNCTVYLNDKKISRLFGWANSHLTQYGMLTNSEPDNYIYYSIQYPKGNINTSVNIHYELIYNRLPDNAKKAFDKALESMYD